MKKILEILLLICSFLGVEHANGAGVEVDKITSEAGQATIEVRVRGVMPMRKSYLMKLTLPYQLKPFNYEEPTQYVLANSGGTLLAFNGEFATKAYCIGVITINGDKSVKTELNLSGRLKKLLQEEHVSISSEEALYVTQVTDRRITVRYQADNIQNMFGFIVEIGQFGDIRIVKNSIRYDVSKQ